MEPDNELYERQTTIVDVQIDKVVYDLYGLCEEEIEVVEGGGWSGLFFKEIQFFSNSRTDIFQIFI